MRERFFERVVAISNHEQTIFHTDGHDQEMAAYVNSLSGYLIELTKAVETLMDQHETFSERVEAYIGRRFFGKREEKKESPLTEQQQRALDAAIYLLSLHCDEPWANNCYLTLLQAFHDQ